MRQLKHHHTTHRHNFRKCQRKSSTHQRDCKMSALCRNPHSNTNLQMGEKAVVKVKEKVVKEKVVKVKEKAVVLNIFGVLGLAPQNQKCEG